MTIHMPTCECRGAYVNDVDREYCHIHAGLSSQKGLLLSFYCNLGSKTMLWYHILGQIYLTRLFLDAPLAPLQSPLPNLLMGALSYIPVTYRTEAKDRQEPCNCMPLLWLVPSVPPPAGCRWLAQCDWQTSSVAEAFLCPWFLFSPS